MVSVLCIVLGVLNSRPHAEEHSASTVTITQTVQRDAYQIPDSGAGTTVEIPGGPPPTVALPNGRRPFQIPSGNNGGTVEIPDGPPPTVSFPNGRRPFQIPSGNDGGTVEIPGGPPPTVSFPNGRRPFQIPSGNDAGVVKGARPSIPTGATMDPLPRRPGAPASGAVPRKHIGGVKYD